MDVGRLGIVALALHMIACSSSKTVSGVFPVMKESCESTAVHNQFLVKWTNGSITTEKANSREDFIREFVEKKLDQIEFVEQDQNVAVPVRHAAAVDLEFADNWGAARIHADDVWTQGIRGQGIKIAVIDTGVDVTHPQLKNQIAYNQGEMGLDDQGRDKSSNGIDDDANGLIDDWAGYHFLLKTGDGVDAADHGTHISGIIAAEHYENTITKGFVQGVAPDSKIIASGFMDHSGGGKISTVIKALDYAVSRGANVINASWGSSSCSANLKEKIASLYDRNIAFVTAAGNETTDIDFFQQFPASYNLKNEFTIGAIGPYNAMADFSNYGDALAHLFAPGVDIYSTVPGGKIAAMSGTSMAAPFVTAAIGLLMSHRPSADLDQIRQAIYQSVETNSLYRNLTHGRLNVAKAIRALELLVP